MDSTQSLIREFLKDVGAMDTPRLGPGPVTTPPAQERIDRFRVSIERVAKRNRRISILMLILHVLVLCLVSATVIVVREAQGLGVAVAGGGTALILGLLSGLRSTWREASAQDLLLAVIPSLQPAEILHVLEGIHYGRQAR